MHISSDLNIVLRIAIILLSISIADGLGGLSDSKYYDPPANEDKMPSPTCFMPCPFVIDPICAANRKRYKLFTNRCAMNTHICTEQENWKEVDSKFCDRKPHQTIEDCRRNCDNHIAPVCAFDGHIYKLFWNKCERLERECIDDLKWKRADFEMCSQNSTCVNSCPSETDYVCGTDGKTYIWFQSICDMEWENCKAKDKHWEVVPFCKCLVRSERVLRKKCDIKCAPVYDPVCARSGDTKKTFINICAVTLYNCLNCGNYTVIHPKPCERDSLVESRVTQSTTKRSPHIIHDFL